MTSMTILYALIAILAIAVVALFIKLRILKTAHYRPCIGEIYREKIAVDLDDMVYASHNTNSPVGTVRDYFNISLKDPTINISLPFEAISKNGRFLIIASGNQPYWVEPNNLKSKYSIQLEKYDAAE